MAPSAAVLGTLVAVAQLVSPAAASLTAQEVTECRAQPELFAFEANGGVVLEMMLFAYAIVLMHVLIEEWYVPALELVTSPDVLDVPRPLLGCTIMAAGNCLPELSMSLVALLVSGNQDIGTGEVFGSCVFDLCAILGVVCVRMPSEGAQLAPSLMLYLIAWAAIATAADVSLFYADVETTWPASISLVSLYVVFVVVMFACNALFPRFATSDSVAGGLLAVSHRHLTQAPVAGEDPSSGVGGSVVDAPKLYAGAMVACASEKPGSGALVFSPSAGGAVNADRMESGVPPAPDTHTALTVAVEEGGARTGAPRSAWTHTYSDGSTLVACGGSASHGMRGSQTAGTAAKPALLAPRGTPAARETTPLLMSPTAGRASGSPCFAAAPAEVSQAPGSPTAGAEVGASGAASDGARGSASQRLLARAFDVLAAPPRCLFRCTVPMAEVPSPLLGGRRPWLATLVVCILYTLLLSYTMVAVASRAICLLGIRKNSLGATVLCLAAGFPDLLTAMILVRRPGMLEMAVRRHP